MKQKSIKSNNLKINPAFFPHPRELAERKVTFELDDESIAFFKRQAKKFKTPYQAMIRNLLQQYALRAEKE